MLYINVRSYDDYDRVARYLFERKVSILKRSKLDKVLTAEVTHDFVWEMTNNVQFDGAVSYGEAPLDPYAID